MSGADASTGLFGRRTVVATLAALVPGAGHVLLGQRALGAGLAAGLCALLGVVVAHVAVGLSALEGGLGTLLAAHLMRCLGVAVAFSVVDVYLGCVDPAGRVAPPLRRRAVAANLILPGTGYVLCRAWIRAGTGLLLLLLVGYFARVGHPYVDIIFVGLQVVMAVAVYRQVRVTEQEGGAPVEPAAPAEPLPHVQGGQVVVLVALVGCLVWVGWVTETYFPPRLSAAGARAVRAGDDVRFSAPGLGIELRVHGPGWSVAPPESGSLFQASHADGGRIMIGVQPVPPFMPADRFVRRVAQWVGDRGFSLRKTLDITLGDRPAVQMRFSGNFGETGRVDQWAVVVPGQRQGVVLLLSCLESACPFLAPKLEQTRDSLRVTRP